MVLYSLYIHSHNSHTLPTAHCALTTSLAHHTLHSAQLEAHLSGYDKPGQRLLLQNLRAMLRDMNTKFKEVSCSVDMCVVCREWVLSCHVSLI